MINSSVNTKKCPMCAEQIPLAAVNCQYCGAQFKVTNTGYCQNCRQVREADEHGCCKVCNGETIDRRVESRLIEESVREPLPVSPPATKTEIPKTGKSRLPIGILAGILVFTVIGAVLWVGRNSIPTVSSLLATNTPTATMTFTPTNTSTATLTPTAARTRTPRPTLTATPDQRVLNPANQHLYLYVRIGKTWHEARDYCAAQNGHLVTIQAPSENRFIYELATENHDVGTWLGATDEAEEGTWVWVTGEPASYWNWGEYWNYFGKSAAEDFLTFGDEPRTWSPREDGENYFVCEWEQ